MKKIIKWRRALCTSFIASAVCFFSINVGISPVLAAQYDENGITTVLETEADYKAAMAVRTIAAKAFNELYGEYNWPDNARETYSHYTKLITDYINKKNNGDNEPSVLPTVPTTPQYTSFYYDGFGNLIFASTERTYNNWTKVYYSEEEGRFYRQEYRSSGNENIFLRKDNKYKNYTFKDWEYTHNDNEYESYTAKWEKKPADYTAVDQVIEEAKKIDLSMYTDESVEVLKNAINAVDRNKKFDEQNAVDEYEKDIKKAITSLNKKSADYSKVYDAIAAIPDNLKALYTSESIVDVNSAKNAVKYYHTIDEQDTVDAYAEAINNAVARLVRTADYTAVYDALRKSLIPQDVYDNHSQSYALKIQKLGINAFLEETVQKYNLAVEDVVYELPPDKQSVVDEYAKKINEAVEGLVFKNADYEELLWSISRNLDGSIFQYTDDGTGKEGDDFYYINWGKYYYLPDVIKQNIDKIIENEKEYLTNKNYTDESIADFFETIKLEEMEWDLTGDDQDVVDGYYDRLLEAQKKLVYKPADYTKLKETVATYKDKIENEDFFKLLDNNAESFGTNYYKILIDTIHEGEELLKNENMLSDQQEYIDGIADSIKFRYEYNLKHYADYSEVYEALQLVPKDLNRDLYTNSSLWLLDRALEYEKNRWKESQDIVDLYAKDIRDAVAGLELKPKHTVTFEDGNGKILKKEIVLHRNSATPPEEPARDGFTFTGWSPSSFEDVQSDETFKAQWEEMRAGEEMQAEEEMPADYTDVYAAVHSVPSLKQYTDDSVKAVREAIAAVVEGKKISEQDIVDEWARDIYVAVMNLKDKPIDPVTPDEPTEPTEPTIPTEPEEKSDTSENKYLFNDVTNPKSAFYDAIYWAADCGITTGVTPTMFYPDKAVTRGQMVTFLWRYAGSPEPSSLREGKLTDVRKDSVFYKAINWALENGITTGFDDNTFRQDEECTRGQIVTFLWRFSGKPVPSDGKLLFSDVKKEGNVFYDAIYWAAGGGITTGFDDNTFRQDAQCTRGQGVTFLYRYNR